MTSPEELAREHIDALLQAAGWHVCNYKEADIHAARGVAIREFQLTEGHGAADYAGRSIYALQQLRKVTAS